MKKNIIYIALLIAFFNSSCSLLEKFTKEEKEIVAAEHVIQQIVEKQDKELEKAPQEVDVSKMSEKEQKRYKKQLEKQLKQDDELNFI